MSDAVEKFFILQERERQLQEHLRQLEQRVRELQQEKYKQVLVNIEKVNLDIKHTQAELAEVKKDLEIHKDKNKLNNVEKDNSDKNKFQWDNVLLGVDIVNSLLTGGRNKQEQEELMKIQLVQNQPVIENQIKNTYLEITNPENNLKSYSEVNKMAQKALDNEQEKKIGALIDSKSIADEKDLPSSYIEWEKDIQKREQDLKTQINQKYENKLIDTEKSFEIQKQNVEKYIKSEEKENKIEELNSELKKEKFKILIEKENALKNNPEIKELENEKNALQNALDSTKELDVKARSEEIKRKQEEYERQRLDLLKKIR